VVLRAALTFVPTMHAWSLNHQRFLPPLAGWMTWVLAVLALVPALARSAAPALTRLGDWIMAARVRGTLACMAGSAALVWLLPDRVRFVGDFLLRQGTVEEAEKPSVIFPQALPLDVVLHYRLPLLLTGWNLSDANGAARTLGAIEAALLAWLALVFARVLGRRGVPALVTVAVVVFGGALGMLTGYSKAFSELMLLAVAVAASGLAALRDDAPGAGARGLLPLGFAVATGVVLHRSALTFTPALALAWGLWLRRAPAGAWRRPAVIAALAIPLAAIAIMTPRIVADVLKWDTVHFNPAEVQAGGGPFRAALAHGRPLDLLNLLLLLSPLAIAAPAMAWLLRRELPRRAELLFLIVLALPMVLGAPFIHPAQGLFRDWDDFAPTGVAISLVVAWLAGETLRLAPARAWIGVGLMAGVMVPAGQWLAIHADLDRGLPRVYAFMREPPPRTPAERAKTWDYLGIVNYRRQHWSEAAEALGHAAETGPSYRVLLEWAMSTTNTGDLEGAARIYRRLLARNPDAPYGWLGLAAVSSRLADAAPPGSVREAHLAESRRTARRLLELQPGNADALGLLAYLDRKYGAARDSTRR
jgi:tetratricopeptide (TPR) repeat protein